MFKMTIAGYDFTLRFEESAAPQTVAFIKNLLPLEDEVIHVRWSGGAIWIPFGQKYSTLDLDYENATCHPAPGNSCSTSVDPANPNY